jgi:hypothetical protein
MNKLSIVVLALVLVGVAVALPQNFGSFGGQSFGGGFGNGGTQEVESFQRLPGGGFIEDDKTTR